MRSGKTSELVGESPREKPADAYLDFGYLLVDFSVNLTGFPALFSSVLLYPDPDRVCGFSSSRSFMGVSDTDINCQYLIEFLTGGL
ncbi:hypothetical protein U1Q18_004416 [Sarracenia purpurea var. burkii]